MDEKRYWEELKEYWDETGEEEKTDVEKREKMERSEG